MNIVAADWLPYCLPFRRPWQTSQGILGERHGRLRRLQTDDGLTGWGDCAPLPEFGIDEAAATAFAEETARLDITARRARLPLGSWLAGAPPRRSVAVNAALGAISTLTDAALAEAIAARFTILKLKVGGASIAAEIARLQEICAALPAGVRLRLDANGAWDEVSATAFLAACASLPVEGLEEPLRTPTLEALRRLQENVPFRLALDESMHLVDNDFWRAPPVGRLIIKPARLGGLLASMQLALRARKANVECIVTASLESACGLTACAHLAAAIAPEACHGLATADWFVTDTGTPPAIVGGRLQLPQGPGLGFTTLKNDE